MRLRLKIGLLVAATAVSVTAVNAVDQPAFAGRDRIINSHSRLCLQPVPDPFQNITDNGVRIAQVECSYSLLEQYWQTTYLGTGASNQPFYYVVNQRSNKCLDVTDAHTNDRATIQQFDCNNGGSEMWYLPRDKFHDFSFLNRRTFKCLDVPNAMTTPGYIWQYHCTQSNVAQSFEFTL